MSTLTKESLAIVLKNIELTKDSSKVTHHLELDISNSPFAFQVGDAVGVTPKNDPKTVEQILRLGAFSKRAEVQNRKGKLFNFEDFLLEQVDLQRASHKLIHVAKSISPAIRGKLDLMSKKEHVSVLQIVAHADFLEIEEQEFITLLKPMMPRFYSIASSPKENANQIDLLVRLSTYSSIFDEAIIGTCTDYLCNRVGVGSALLIRHHPSKNFGLQEGQNPLVMIGSGTGLAPFRGFLQERVLEDRRDNWLFFGERNEQSDFYYQEELEKWEREGFLKLTTAFSRDQEEKIYVQDRLWENRELLWEWIENKAIIYICGDAKKMAKAVQDTFIKIFNQRTTSGQFFFKQLRKEGRIAFDVY